MADHDFIPDLEKLGYTPREAGFLALVAMHSGYFLRRHFNRYLHREDGGLAHSFLAKAQSKGHVRTLPLAQRRFVFHLSSRTLYRLCGVEDSQNRRVKGDRAIKTLLLSLDYILDHPQQHFFRTEAQMLEYFHDQLGIPLEKMPAVVLTSPQGDKRTCYFVDRFPMSILALSEDAQPKVSFSFVDDGVETIVPFQRFLQRHELLLRSIPSSEVVYVAESRRHFAEAGRIFARMFPRLAGHVAARECPLGVDHFIGYLRVRQLFSEDQVSPTFEQSKILAEAGSIYKSASHEELFRAWKNCDLNEHTIRSRYSPTPISISIRGYLIHATFPQNGPKYRGLD